MATRKKISSWYGSLSPGWQLGIAAGSAFILYKIGKAIFSNDNSGGTSDVLNVGKNLTYTENDYKTLADAIEAAIWGTWALPSITEDDQAIGDILMMMQTDDDVAMLNNKYGKRFRGVLFEDGGNLTQSIHAYLDQDVKNQVNQYYRSSGINWQFL